MEAIAIPSYTANATAKFFIQDVIFQHGCPQIFLANNETDFKTCVVPILNKLLGIELKHVTLYQPKANGVIEQVNRTLLNLICKLVHSYN